MVRHILYICLDEPSDELYSKYNSKVIEHNNMVNNSSTPDSGFDLLMPFKNEGRENNTYKIDFKVKGAMMESSYTMSYNDMIETILSPCAYYLYPRSSISKTNFRLSNNVGIIDSGYRGNLCAYFDVSNHHHDNKYTMECYQRLLQVCSNTLQPFYVKLVDNFDSFNNTERMDNGFGSTGN